MQISGLLSDAWPRLTRLRVNLQMPLQLAGDADGPKRKSWLRTPAVGESSRLKRWGSYVSLAVAPIGKMLHCQACLLFMPTFISFHQQTITMT